MSEPQAKRTSGVPSWVTRWLINVALLLATALIGALIVLVFYDFHRRNNLHLGFVPYAWFLATLWLAPGGLAYLTILEMIPTRWSEPARRALAVLLTPLVLLGAAVYGVRGPLSLDPWIYALLAAFGLVVRLRHSVSESGPNMMPSPS